MIIPSTVTDCQLRMKDRLVINLEDPANHSLLFVTIFSLPISQSYSALYRSKENIPQSRRRPWFFFIELKIHDEPVFELGGRVELADLVPSKIGDTTSAISRPIDVRIVQENRHVIQREFEIKFDSIRAVFRCLYKQFVAIDKSHR